jgi:hypothetical protein
MSVSEICDGGIVGDEIKEKRWTDKAETRRAKKMGENGM